MRFALIANPAAGTAEEGSRAEDVAQALVGQGHAADVHLTEGPRHAETLARDAADQGVDVVVAAGGDGTLNEVLNGVAASARRDETALAILPVGTGNDFARMLGIESPDAALAALLDGHVRTLDVVDLGGRLFLNASAGGFTAETSAKVSSDLKQVVGKLAYLIGGAQAFLEYEPVRTHVETSRGAFDLDLQLFAVCNGAYIGGGHQLAPTAVPDDGEMEVCLVRAGSTLDFLTLLPRLSSGEHLDEDDVTYFRAREISLTFERSIKINTDGEVLDASACHYVMRPGGVRFVAPPVGASTART
ncbi:MAG TPA: diacylglycerol kinase family protein [Luteitalea sp.]|nr:diacylglycerol kinase family protein [Luteitalea sp.]